MLTRVEYVIIFKVKCYLGNKDFLEEFCNQRENIDASIIVDIIARVFLKSGLTNALLICNLKFKKLK